MAKFIAVKGTTSQIVHLFVQSAGATNGAGFTGLSFSASGLAMAYIRPGSAGHATVTLTGSGINLGTFTSGAFLEVSAGTMPGVYEFHVPNAAITSGASRVVFMVQGNASIAPTPFEIQLVDVNLEDSVRLGLTSIPNTVAGATGGLILFSATSGGLNPTAGNVTLAAATHAGVTIPNVTTVATVNTATRCLLVDTATVTLNVSGTVAGSVASVTGNLSGTVANVALLLNSAIAPLSFQTGAIDAAVIATDAGTEIANAILDQANGIETGYTVRQAGRLLLSASAAKLSGALTTTIAIRDVGDSKDRITATVDASGNRTAITLDAT